MLELRQKESYSALYAGVSIVRIIYQTLMNSLFKEVAQCSIIYIEITVNNHEQTEKNNGYIRPKSHRIPGFAGSKSRLI